MEEFNLRPLRSSGKSGIVYICFGEQYDLVGSYSSRTVRKHSNLPIYVITNVPEKKRSKKWTDTDIDFLYLDWPDEKNREVKTKLPSYSPFDYTLHIDADLACNSPKAFLPLKYLSHWDMVAVSWNTKFDSTKHPWNTISAALNTSKHSVVAGCCLFFNKNSRVEKLFNFWHNYWEQEGCLRDMGALFKAVWMSEIRIYMLPEKQWMSTGTNTYFSHSGGNAKIKGLPKITKFKPNSYKAVADWKHIRRKQK